MRNFLFAGFALLVVLTLLAGPALARDRVKGDFRRADINHDGRLDRIEWHRRGNFDRLDRNHDGMLSLREVRAIYAGQSNKNYRWPPQGMTTDPVEFDQSVRKDIVRRSELDEKTICGIGRMRSCPISAAVNLGMLATGMGPRFPANAKCPGIDDYWALDYSFKRNRTSYHGGIDIPARWGAPIIAAADGSVVAIYNGEESVRGIELVLRHSPRDTGLPFWTYTQYAHLDRMPDLRIAQRVRKGQIIGPTGNSGVSGKKRARISSRRPAIHFAVYYSKNRHYMDTGKVIIPANGRWMDPIAFYRQKQPFDSRSARMLADSEKDVAVPVMFGDGTYLPSNTKLVWPYICGKD